ncbi:MAG: 4'-phosphopantetheinyl transferase superfamily protein [Tabrizicola sp.]|jgi:4'-phosphopantetheinyl transferase|nr:4'-phosphopantetheinyl transferase superfamily protein [Tabrizicola sp.]
MTLSFRHALPTLPPGLALRICRLDDDGDIALHQAASTLAKVELDRAAAFNFDRDRNRFVRARGFLRREVSAVLGYHPEKLAIRIGPHGKPFVDGHSLGFNLSHSAGLAVLALNADGPVGVDVESLALVRNTADLCETCLTFAERNALKAAPDASRDSRFLAFWTAKEAAVKLTGTGWSVEPKTVELSLVGGLPMAVQTPPARLISIPVPGHLCYMALPANEEASR